MIGSEGLRYVALKRKWKASRDIFKNLIVCQTCNTMNVRVKIKSEKVRLSPLHEYRTEGFTESSHAGGEPPMFAHASVRPSL